MITPDTKITSWEFYNENKELIDTLINALAKNTINNDAETGDDTFEVWLACGDWRDSPTVKDIAKEWDEQVLEWERF